MACFDKIQPEQVTSAIAYLLEHASIIVTQLKAPEASVTWAFFVAPMENVTEKLGRAWGIVDHLNAVMNSPALRAVYNENQPKLIEF